VFSVVTVVIVLAVIIEPLGGTVDSFEEGRESAFGLEVQRVENPLGVRALLLSPFVRSGGLDALADENDRQGNTLQERLAIQETMRMSPGLVKNLGCCRMLGQT
jgi:hypothetical protein